MPNYPGIISTFIAGTSPDAKGIQEMFNRNKVRVPLNGRPLHGGAWNVKDKLRMSFTDTTLLSYEHWPLAVRQMTPQGTTIIVNGDGAPTNTTKGQQNDLRRIVSAAVAKGTHKSCIIPFSALAAALGCGMHRVGEAIELVATTPDRDVLRTTIWKPTERIKTCYTHEHAKEPHEHVRTEHFLGETLFKAQNRFYVCGLDRNDSPSRRNFYLARLPRGVQPSTVEEALHALCPEYVPSNSPRQGEWFFVPAPNLARHLVKDEMKQVPIQTDTTDTTITNPNVPVKDLPAWSDRRRRHVAARMIKGVDGWYVKGKITDADHDMLDLGDQWHRVVRNLADGSWTVDKNGPKVD